MALDTPSLVGETQNQVMMISCALSSGVARLKRYHRSACGPHYREEERMTFLKVFNSFDVAGYLSGRRTINSLCQQWKSEPAGMHM